MSGADQLRIPDLPPILRFSGEFRFLSNFYESEIVPDGPWWRTAVYPGFPTVEHAFQAAKVAPDTENYVEHYDEIREAESPREAKRLGSRGGFEAAGATLRSDWEFVKVPVMLACLRAKFPYGSALADRLQSTTPRVLVEGNAWGDRFWGVDGSGNNLLGKCLMLVRQELIIVRSTGVFSRDLWGPR